MICPNCGKNLPDGAVVCRHCGRLLSSGAESGVEGMETYARAVAPVTDVAARKRTLSTHLGLVIAAIVLCFAALVTIFSMLMINLAESGKFDSLVQQLEPGVLPIDQTDPSDTFVLSGAGYADTDSLVKAYIDAFVSSDTDTIAMMFVPGMYQAYDLDADALLTDWDAWYENYGYALGSYEITGSQPYDASEYAGLDEELNVTFEQLQNVSVRLSDVEMEDGSEPVMEFDLAMVDGVWYLIQVW